MPSASDADLDELTFRIENQPNWAEFDTSTGQLFGVPFLGSEGMYENIMIEVSDGDMASSLPQFSIIRRTAK